MSVSRSTTVSFSKVASFLTNQEPEDLSRYWNWVLDSDDLTESPIWHSDDGFGGNGNIDGDVVVGHGRCVTNGPFANLGLRHYDGNQYPHCLSRGFLRGELLDQFGKARTSPNAIEKVLNVTNYYSFLLGLENGAHAAIPICVRGDFSKVTAPNGKC